LEAGEYAAERRKPESVQPGGEEACVRWVGERAAERRESVRPGGGRACGREAGERAAGGGRASGN